MNSTMRRRRATALAVLGTMSFVQACASYQRPRGVPTPGMKLRVTAKSPIPVYAGPLATGVATCEATVVEGTVQRSSGDTLTLGGIRRASVNDRAAACSRENGLTLITQREGVDLRVRRMSVTRTTLLVVGLVVIVGLATSHKSDGGCNTCPY